MATNRWLTAPLTVALALLGAGCLKPVNEPDCLRDGLCECKAKADCSNDRDCVDGRCVIIIDAGIGELGWPCTANADCLHGPCLPQGPGNGRICTVECTADAGWACPRSWACVPNTSDAGGSPFACTPPTSALCLPCRSDGDCNALGDRCLTVGTGSFCARDCTVDTSCPGGFTCRSVNLGGQVTRQCLPTANTCECSVATAGAKRGCKKTANLGTCYGFQTCLTDGTWAGCDARDASVEVCNGLDDDCDGLTDQADPKLDTSAVPGYPSCAKGSACLGRWSCQGLTDGGGAFSCSAKDPTPEVCNGVDDNCNGIVDDGLTDDAGSYASPRACGSCNNDCYLAIANLASDGGVVVDGAATCEVRNGTRTCVPQKCAKGTFASPVGTPAACEPAVTSQCRPCSSSGDCIIPGDQCVTVGSDPGQFCAQSCDPSSPYLGCTGALGTQDCCPSGNTCRAVNGQKLCVPNGNSCQCSSSNMGYTRSCTVTAATATCVGLQTCSNGSYGTCDTSKTTAEFCNGKDDDCDGVIDNGFINTRRSGTYDTDQNCGACQNDCTAKWSPTIQHALGGCRVALSRKPLCSIVQCTTESVGGGGACRVDGDCTGGRTCNTTYHQCVQSCGAAALCGGSDRCVGGSCGATCGSDAQCQATYGAPSTCQGGVCQVTYQFANADNEDTNGCECATAQGVSDVPDTSAAYPTPGLPYVDSNCDGLDGDAASSLFVWALSPSSQGTRTAPYKTIAEALAAFRPGVHSAILVAQGTYLEQVVLKSGVALYGGYASDFLSRDVINKPTLVEGAEPALTSTVRGTVNAENLGARTVLSGFIIHGYDVVSRPAPGAQARNSYAVYVKNSPGLVLQNNHLVGGNGGDAVPASAGAAGATGGAGVDGVAARECGSPSCLGEAQQGGAAGTNASCPASVGASGAGSSISVDPQQYTSTANGNGRGGFNAQYFHSDPSQNALCKYDCQVPSAGMAGGAAQNGGDGSAGASGLACTAPLGNISGDDWVSPGASAGNDGSPGKGGGGGGAGGCVSNLNDATCSIGHRVGDLGATGGGGGAGGCGGGRGLGAAGGGASFAVLVVGPAPTIIGNLIDLGFGGIGGSGGVGGYGGLGGQGGRGGQSNSVAWCAGLGGPGGRGGNGGAGSGGGGGCGGSAFGIAGQNVGGAGYAARNTFGALPMNAGGQGGLGGASPAGASFKGGDGATGVVATVQGF